MIELVIGAAASGKSEYAQDRCKILSGGENLIYLATMMSEDEESKRRIEKHRINRDGMNFSTVELPYDIGKIKIDKPDTTVLIECITNLVANEMFCRTTEQNTNEKFCRTSEKMENDKSCRTSKNLPEKILRDIVKIKANPNVSNIVMVSGNVFEDGVEYDEFTGEYIKNLGIVNTLLAKEADKVTEVVCSIAVDLL